MIPFFSRMFPGTNLQDLNLDWIVRRIMELSKGIIAPWINAQNQHWMVYDTAAETFVDSGVSAAGEGTGPQGEPGKSPVIGSNGNWYTWDPTTQAYTDTGTPAEGPVGPAGPAGPAGPEGPAADMSEVAIVITGNRPAMAVAAGQYVIVQDSTITGVADGLYTAVNALSPSTDVVAADLTAVSVGGLNDISQKWATAYTSAITGGELNVYVNRSLGLGLVQWQGNADNLTSGNHDFTIPSGITPKYTSTMPMFTNDGTGFLRIFGTTVRVRVSTDTANSACSIFYVLS